MMNDFALNVGALGATPAWLGRSGPNRQRPERPVGHRDPSQNPDLPNLDNDSGAAAQVRLP